MGKCPCAYYHFLQPVGYEDGTVALFDFGVDSFVQVSSGVGIWHMIRRMKQNSSENHDAFEKSALKVTGTAFYILSVGLIGTALVNLYQGHKPETTFGGIVVVGVSILSMWLLIHDTLKIDRQFNSQGIEKHE